MIRREFAAEGVEFFGGWFEACFGSDLVEGEGLAEIAGDAAAGFEEACELDHGAGVAFVSGFFVDFGGGFEIDDAGGTGFEHDGELDGGVDVAVLHGAFAPCHGGLGVGGDAFAVAVADGEGEL